MKKYERPVVLVNEELAEGVYAASGAVCYTFTAKITQTPENGRGTYAIQIDGKHDAADGHHSTERTVQISFNQAVTHSQSNASSVSGNGSSVLILEYTNESGNYHNNAEDNIGLGQLYVISDAGLAVTGIVCTQCNMDCSQH
ncbi:MAG: hypothetical protein IKL22_07120 [Lachnospiraceae bacterium]|nr:hypothetical protein [Lachnospiraceae bacterium]